MANDDRDDERERLIDRLKARAADAGGGHMVAYESDALTPDFREQFWRRVIDFEAADETNLVTELNRIGVPLPEPDDLDDAALSHALWRTIEGLATLRVFLHWTDHLSDRELYTRLVRELLPEQMPALDDDDGSSWHIHVLGSDEPELYLKYYADEKSREFWSIDFPDMSIPDREDLPYDRDAHLPRADF